MLTTLLTHHVQEEESKVLPGMRESLDANRLQELGDAFAISREKLADELKPRS